MNVEARPVDDGKWQVFVDDEPFGVPREKDDLLAYAKRIAKRYPGDTLTLLIAAKQVRREVLVQHNGKSYRFTSKAEARRTMRHILNRKRLPTEVAQQIERVDGKG